MSHQIDKDSNRGKFDVFKIVQTASCFSFDFKFKNDVIHVLYELKHFRALLFGGLKESFLQQQDIELVGATPGAFRYLLQYIYTGKLNLGSMKVRYCAHPHINMYAWVNLQSCSILGI